MINCSTVFDELQFSTNYVAKTSSSPSSLISMARRGISSRANIAPRLTFLVPLLLLYILLMTHSPLGLFSNFTLGDLMIVQGHHYSRKKIAYNFTIDYI